MPEEGNLKSGIVSSNLLYFLQVNGYGIESYFELTPAR
jgi:hypothetical protein